MMEGFDYDVAIIGAGPAGSSLAIRLARSGRRVVLLEKDTMPRDKLCGEFLSTEVGALCGELGVMNAIKALGAEPIRSAVISGPFGPVLEVDLPGTAMGMSRRTFDQVLFRHAADEGVEALDGTAVIHVAGGLGSGFNLDTQRDKWRARVAVAAYGRQTVLDRKLERASLHDTSPTVAFKAHHWGDLPVGVVEVHTFRGGYCGLLVEEEGRVNVCWIIHQDRLKEAGGTPHALAAKMAGWNPHLGRRLAALEPSEEYLAVSRLTFYRKEIIAGDVCMIGDAAGMIAPLCGDGIGMALQSARTLAPLIGQYLDGTSTAEQFRDTYARRWRQEFIMRMAAGRMLQRTFVRPQLLRPGLALARSAPIVARAMVAVTRG